LQRVSGARRQERPAGPPDSRPPDPTDGRSTRNPGGGPSARGALRGERPGSVDFYNSATHEGARKIAPAPPGPSGRGFGSALSKLFTPREKGFFFDSGPAAILVQRLTNFPTCGRPSFGGVREHLGSGWGQGAWNGGGVVARPLRPTGDPQPALFSGCLVAGLPPGQFEDCASPPAPPGSRVCFGLPRWTSLGQPNPRIDPLHVLAVAPPLRHPALDVAAGGLRLPWRCRPRGPTQIPPVRALVGDPQGSPRALHPSLLGRGPCALKSPNSRLRTSTRAGPALLVGAPSPRPHWCAKPRLSVSAGLHQPRRDRGASRWLSLPETVSPRRSRRRSALHRSRAAPGGLRPPPVNSAAAVPESPDVPFPVLSLFGWCARPPAFALGPWSPLRCSGRPWPISFFFSPRLGRPTMNLVDNSRVLRGPFGGSHLLRCGWFTTTLAGTLDPAHLGYSPSGPKISGSWGMNPRGFITSPQCCSQTPPARGQPSPSVRAPQSRRAGTGRGGAVFLRLVAPPPRLFLEGKRIHPPGVESVAGRLPPPSVATSLSGLWFLALTILTF